MTEVDMMAGRFLRLSDKPLGRKWHQDHATTPMPEGFAADVRAGLRQVDLIAKYGLKCKVVARLFYEVLDGAGANGI